MTNEPMRFINKDVNLKGILKNTTKLTEVKIVTSQQANGQCGLITFDKLENFQPIPQINLGFTIATFDSSWISFNIPPSPPSPYMSADIYLDSIGNISLSNPISSVSFYYLSFANIRAEVYDLNGVLLASTTAPANYPVPNVQWDPVTINIGENVISTIRIIDEYGYGDQIAIDNIELCITQRQIRGIPSNVKELPLCN